MKLTLAILFAVLCIGAINCALRPCDPKDPQDLQGIYLRCNDETNKRSMAWYYSIDCDSTGLALPEPISDLPCDVKCKPGYYLPWGDSSCKACGPGSFSTGNGVTISHWDALPSVSDRSINWRTLCSRPSNVKGAPKEICEGWKPEGYYISSGDLSKESSVYSILITSFIIQESSGTMQFSYQVEGETNNGLYLQIDNEGAHRLPNTAEWTSYSRKFTKGLHFVTWIYYQREAVKGANDIAKIDSFSVDGLEPSNYCSKCSPGYVQPNEKSSACLDCGFNEIASGFGNTECQPCDADHYALRAQGTCIEKTEKCTEDDMTATYSECEEGKSGWSRTLSYAWEQPQICKVDKVELPEAKTEQSCLECQPGFEAKSKKSAECEPCDPGYAGDGSSKCKSCKQGTAALPELHYLNWSSMTESELEKSFNNTCSGNCMSNGWERFYSSDKKGKHIVDELRTAKVLGTTVDISLEKFVKIGSHGGSTQFTFNLFGDQSQSYFEFFIDGYFQQLWSDTKKEITASFELNAGVHQLVWNFRRNDAKNKYPDAGAAISAISISGVSSGGVASTCTSCKAGYFQKDDKQTVCEICPAGKYSSSKESTSCEDCVGNTFSAPGSTECTTCSVGTNATAKHDDCITNCVFVVPAEEGSEEPELKYNIAPLMGTTQYVEASPESYYLVNFCRRLEKKECETGGYVCEKRQTKVANTITEASFDAGYYLNFKPHGDKGFTLSYSSTETEGCKTGSTRQTTIAMNCDLEEKNPKLTLKSSSQCSVKLEYNAPQACRICTSDDFERETGSCDDGKKTITLTKKKDSVCLSEEALEQEESCGDVELGIGYVVIIIVGIVALFLILAAVIVVIYRKKRALEVKYSKLQNVGDGSGGVTMEMAEMDTEL